VRAAFAALDRECTASVATTPKHSTPATTSADATASFPGVVMARRRRPCHSAAVRVCAPGRATRSTG
jgi:hypothetical protein